jgi:alpha-mannosidase
MPDQFGHIGQMPQLLRHAGIERAMVWRGVPSAIATSTFRWRSPDGSEVLTESLPLGYSSGWSLMRGEDRQPITAALSAEVERLRPFAPHGRIVVMVGYDHAGPDASLPARLADAVTGEVDVEIASVASHVASLPASGDLPVWTGELRSSARAHLLPNVYSARVHQKRERGRVEALLERYAEPLAALVPRSAWPETELRRAWTLMLWNGAHDSACGCSHDQVALDVDERFAHVRAIATGIAARALATLSERTSAPGVMRFNPSPFEREGVPALGYAVVDEVARPAAASVAIERLDDGSGVSADAIELRLFDEADVGDLYNFCPATLEQRPTAPTSVDVDGERVVASWAGLVVELRITRRVDEPFLRLDGTIRNERHDHRLRLHVALDRPVARTVAGAPFELVERPLVGEGGEGEAPSPTWPARHMVLADDSAVLHEGVFEYEIAEGRAIAVTLLRAVGTISRERLLTRPWAAGPPTPTPAAQMIGETAFSLGVWRGADRDSVLRGWERFALPLLEAPATGGGALPARGTLLELDGAVELSNVRRRDGVVDVRIWNRRSDRAADVTIAGRAARLGPAEIRTVPLHL